MNANLRNFALWVIIVLLLLALLTLGKFAPDVRKVGQSLVVDLIPEHQKRQTATNHPISQPTVNPPPVVLPVVRQGLDETQRHLERRADHHPIMRPGMRPTPRRGHRRAFVAQDAPRFT